MARHVEWNEGCQDLVAIEEQLDRWLPAKQWLLARVASAVRRLDIGYCEEEDVVQKWTNALALDALRACSGLEELALAWPQFRFDSQAASFTKEAMQALQVPVSPHIARN